MTPTDIQRIVRDHIRYHATLKAPTREQQLRGEAKVVTEYRGRVLVELFQNAIDRARDHVLLRLDDNRLVVANDNLDLPLTLYPLDHTATHGRLDRSDFHALCSMDTSRKKAYEAIGNKGIGFKSVFREARSVQVWSLHQGQWWGFRLVHPFTSADAQRIGQTVPPDTDAWPDWQPMWSGVADQLGGVAAPSFYFPEPLTQPPPEAAGPYVTVVVLDLKPKHTLEEQQLAFEKMPLHFVSARYPDKTAVRVQVGDHDRCIDFVDGWAAFPERPRPRPDLVPAAQGEDLSFTDEHPPAVQLAIPPEGLRAHRPHFHCFFPTQVVSGCGVDVHADFLVDPSRKSREFLCDREGNGYNAALLDTAADLLLEALDEHLYARPDVWRFVTPGDGANPSFVARVRERLLGRYVDQVGPWVALCTKAFAHIQEHGAPWSFYEDFWKAMEAWWPHRGSKITWETFHRRIRDPLLHLPVIPVTDGAQQPGKRYGGVPGPQQGQRTVLLRPPDERAGKEVAERPDLPAELMQRVAITGQFPLANARWWAGLQDFSWASLVAPARDWILTITSGSPRWSPDDAATRDAVIERMATSTDPDGVLRALYALALEAEGSPKPAMERLLARARDRITGSEVDRAAVQLRAESALPLPVVDGTFLPACRVVSGAHAIGVANGTDWGVLDRDRLAGLGVTGDDQNRLAARLGCFEVIPLVSGAERGLDLPFDPTTLSVSAWKGLLGPWEERFHMAEDVTFAATLRASPWFPVGAGSAPDDVWQVAANDPLRYPSLPRVHQPGSDLLAALGVFRLPATEDPFDATLDAKATASLVRLAADPHSLLRPREARQVFARLARGLAPEGVPVPALASTGKAKPPVWLDPGHGRTVYLVQRERRSLTRYFPDLLEVAAEGGAERAARYGARPFAPVVTLHPPGQHPVASNIKQQLELAVPWLLTLAEGRRLGVRRSPEEVAALWNLAVVRHCENAYQTLSLEGSDPIEVGYQDDEGNPIVNDAFLADPRTALCDVPDADRDAHRWLPKFAAWFATAMFSNERLEGPFRSLLQQLGRDWSEGVDQHGRAHLALHELDADRVAELRADFLAACWTPEQRQERIEARRTVLQTFGTLSAAADLLSPWLGADVWLAQGRTHTLAKTVHDALAVAEPIHRVHFACGQANENAWKRRKPALRRDILLGRVLHKGVARWTDDQVADLHQRWEDFAPQEDFPYIDFDPRAAALAAFPGREPADAAERDRALAVLERRPYAELDPAPVDLVTVVPGKAGTGLTKSPKDRQKKQQNQGLRGRKAEEARAEEAARRVAACSPAMRARIDAERHSVRAEVKQKLPPDCLLPIAWTESPDLVAAVHVAAQVDCGYDVLDVDGDDLLRVEVKSHSGSTHGAVQVHLSMNELRRALQTRDQEGVRYRLELYLGYGRRVDATPALDRALQAEWLQTLLTADLEAVPESFLLNLFIPPRRPSTE